MDNPNGSKYSQKGRTPYKRRGSYSRSNAGNSAARNHSRRESLNSSSQSHHRISQNPYGVLSPYTGSSPSIATKDLSNAEHGGHGDYYPERAVNQRDCTAEKSAFLAPSDREIRADTRPHDPDVQLPDDNDNYDTVRRFLYRILTSSGWGISEKYPSAVRATVNDWYGTGYYLRLRYCNNDLKDICPATWMGNQFHRNLPEAIDRRLRDMIASCVIHEVGKCIDGRYGNQASRLSCHDSFTSLGQISNMNSTWVDSPFEESPVPDSKDTRTSYLSPVAPIPIRPFRRSTVPEAWSPYFQSTMPLYSPIVCTPAPQTPSERFEAFLNESVTKPVVRDYKSQQKQSIRKRTWKSLRGLFVEEQKEIPYESGVFRTIRFEDTAACRSPARDGIPTAHYDGSKTSLLLDPSASETFRSTPFGRTARRLLGADIVEKQSRDCNTTRIGTLKENNSVHSITALESKRLVQNSTDLKLPRNKRSTWYDGQYMQHIPECDDSTSQYARPRSVSDGDITNTIPQQGSSLGFGTETNRKISGTKAHTHIDDGKYNKAITQTENVMSCKPGFIHSNETLRNPARALPLEPLLDTQSSMRRSSHQSRPLSSNVNVDEMACEAEDSYATKPIPKKSSQSGTIQCSTDTSNKRANSLSNMAEPFTEASGPLNQKRNSWGKKLVKAITPANFR